MTPSEEWNRLTLLEKLRKLNVGEFQPGLYAEAADEIERLQAELANETDLSEMRLQSIQKARSAALEEAARIGDDYGFGSHIRALKAQHVVSSAPQSTMEGVFAMGDPEKTDLGVEIANLVGKAIEQGADVEEVKAVLNEVLDELEAQDNGDNDNGEPQENGENA